MFGKEYNVVFEYTEEVPCMDGLRFMANYYQKVYFESQYCGDFKKKHKIVAKNVSHLRGLKLVHDVPLEKYYDSCILSAYDAKKDRIDIGKFSELLNLLIVCRNGFSKSSNNGFSPNYSI